MRNIDTITCSLNKLAQYTLYGREGKCNIYILVDNQVMSGGGAST